MVIFVSYTRMMNQIRVGRVNKEDGGTNAKREINRPTTLLKFSYSTRLTSHYTNLCMI